MFGEEKRKKKLKWKTNFYGFVHDVTYGENKGSIVEVQKSMATSNLLQENHLKPTFMNTLKAEAFQNHHTKTAF